MEQVELVPTMGTVVTIDVRTPTDPHSFHEALHAVKARLEDIDATFSTWRPDSWVSRLVRGEAAPADCRGEVQRVVALALEMMEQTDGYFSPFWRRLPYGDPGPDPTGLVKGWAAQQASDLLIAHGLADHVVNAAGDVVVSGHSDPGAPGRPWRVGISDPHRAGALAGVIDLDAATSRWAVATSGTAELGAHVGDPHTGRFPGSVASATAVTRLDGTHDVDGVDEGAGCADACATALVAAGDHVRALLDRLSGHGVGALYTERDGTVCDPLEMLTVPASIARARSES